METEPIFLEPRLTLLPRLVCVLGLLLLLGASDMRDVGEYDIVVPPVVDTSLPSLRARLVCVDLDGGKEG